MADPVSEFLKQEQEDLAALGLDDSAPPADDAPAPESADPMAAFSSEAAEPTVKEELVENGAHSNGDTNLDDFVMPEEEPKAPEPAVISAPTPSMPRVEPETIRKWKVEFAERLATKDAAEKAAIAKMKEEAKKQLAEAEKQRSEAGGKKKAENRAAEAEFCALRDSTDGGKEWERIARLCEFNPKNSKGHKDLTRMRGLLLQKKAEKA